MFTFNKISYTSINVNSSCNEPSSWSSTVLPRNEVEISLESWFELWVADVNIPKNARYSEWSIFQATKLLEKWLVEHVLRDGL